LKLKFILFSLTQKILIASLCFALNDETILVHRLIIAIKSIIIFYYFLIAPYKHLIFDLFKVLQEICFFNNQCKNDPYRINESKIKSYDYNPRNWYTLIWWIGWLSNFYCWILFNSKLNKLFNLNKSLNNLYYW
jgi:hypothetical protein